MEAKEYEQLLEIKAKEIRALELLAARASTTFTVHRSENVDSLEMGAQATGRIKVYGDFSKKAEFAAKVRDAIEVTEATQTAMKKAGLLKEGKPEKE